MAAKRIFEYDLLPL